MKQQLHILISIMFLAVFLSYCGGKDKNEHKSKIEYTPNNHNNESEESSDSNTSDDEIINDIDDDIYDDHSDDIANPNDDNENSGSETGNPNIVLDENTGRLTFLLTDAPVDNVDHVFVTISEVLVHYVGTSSTSTSTPKSEWITIVDSEQNFDLLELRNNVTALLGTSTLAVGKYTQVRLIVKSASVVVDGVEESLEIPSGDKSGIKLVHGFEITPCGTTTITLDFDAERSLIHKGNSNDNDGNGNSNGKGNSSKPESSEYMMKPTIIVKQSENDNAVCE